ncbi:DUF305 domain-containing protein [Rhizohabitans arisaemae]|uniref:DUF305 domain-containing protein n=1 Tax=Rhizohabitans arisaemae TaxID=2720610 RepID=UPI0024B2366F|nr:DUF305 domain-containing protein [Rhizohabitans arisaemae]
MRSRYVGIAALLSGGLLAGSLTACTGASPQPTVIGTDAPVIVPAGPGEAARTARPGETYAPPSSTANAADVRFIEAMIPHHRQALDMTALARTRVGDGKVRALAERIDTAQKPEISTMATWLRAQGRTVPQGHHGGAPMPGMATAGQLERLRGLRGPSFDRLFLELMIVHHQGALTMSTEVLKAGSDQVIRHLAREIVSGQGIEINRMRKLLARL